MCRKQNLLAGSDPAELVLVVAQLDIQQTVIQVGGLGTDLSVVNDDLLPLVAQLAHRGDHGGGAGTEGLIQPPLVGCLVDLVDGDLPLLGLPAGILCQRQNGIPGHARRWCHR